MKNFLRKNTIQLITLLSVCLLLIIKLSLEDKPYPTGDAIEYTIMTEAFYNHFSPDVRVSDFESFKEAYKKKNKWEENDKAQVYDIAEKFISEENHKNLEYNYAFFVDKEGKKYSAHFFIYSFFNLPMRWICSIIEFNPLLICQITNVLLIIITCFFFFKYTKYTPIETALFVVLFFYSTNYWYVTWQHAEIFSVCFVSLGLWLYLSVKNYIGLFLISVAALQNQPIAIFVGVLGLITLVRNPFTFKNILKLGLSSFLVLIPSLFYFYHYGETNLIKYQGALSFDYVTFTRVFGFFFDLNQGVILALPFILFLYLFLIIRKLVFIKAEKNKWELLIPIALIGAVCIAATIDNWNHGQAVVNRYVTYISAFILVHVFYMIMQFEKKRIKQI